MRDWLLEATVDGVSLADVCALWLHHDEDRTAALHQQRGATDVVVTPWLDADGPDDTRPASRSGSDRDNMPENARFWRRVVLFSIAADSDAPLKCMETQTLTSAPESGHLELRSVVSPNSELGEVFRLFAVWRCTSTSPVHRGLQDGDATPVLAAVKTAENEHGDNEGAVRVSVDGRAELRADVGGVWGVQALVEGRLAGQQEMFARGWLDGCRAAVDAMHVQRRREAAEAARKAEAESVDAAVSSSTPSSSPSTLTSTSTSMLTRDGRGQGAPDRPGPQPGEALRRRFGAAGRAGGGFVVGTGKLKGLLGDLRSTEAAKKRAARLEAALAASSDC